MSHYLQWCYVLLALLMAPSAYAQNQAEGDAVAAWLEREAIPLTSVTPSSGFADLRPLEQILDGARLIGLGEATHGTHEFFTLKHRLLELLVAEMNVTTFLIEASYSASLAVNDYVFHGKGDPGDALSGLGFWIWDTEEITDMIIWLRNYNQGVPEGQRVSFLGFDFQHAEGATKQVNTFLERHLPKEAVGFTLALRQMLSGDKLTTDANTLAQLLPQLRQLVSVLETRRAELVRRTSAATYERIRLQTLMLVQHADVYSAGGFDVAKRNRYMAENVLALLADRPPDARAVMWAHNDHIAKTPAETGIYLENALGDAYYALGFSFDRGTFQAREYTDTGLGDVRVWSVGAAPEGTLDWIFARPKLGNYIIDFGQEPADLQVREWLTMFQPFRMMGCVASKRGQQNWVKPEHFPYIRLDKTFDGMAFVPRTTRARPNLPIRLGNTPC